MKNLWLFSDGSVHAKTKVGFGAYLFVSEEEQQTNPERLKSHIQVKQFEDTSSSVLEIQTLLWALSKVDFTTNNVFVFTDSQNIIGLPSRQKQLEESQYYSKAGKRIGNYELYQQFYLLTDSFKLTFVKLKGHQKTAEKSTVDQLFTLVDRTARKTLRQFVPPFVSPKQF